MKIIPLAVAGVLAWGMASPAAADEVAPEVLECLAAVPGSVTLGQETEGPDTVCLAYDQGVPGDSDWQDSYMWGAPTPLTPATPPPTEEAPPPPPSPGVEPVPTVEEPIALAAPARVTAVSVDTTTARVISKTVRVKYTRVAKASVYKVKCGTKYTKTSKLRAKVKRVTASTCRVKAVGGTWSKSVRISG